MKWKKKSLSEKFLAYLQGIETPIEQHKRLWIFWFLAYLQGIETLYAMNSSGQMLKFLAYLQGIETRRMV